MVMYFQSTKPRSIFFRISSRFHLSENSFGANQKNGIAEGDFLCMRNSVIEYFNEPKFVMHLVAHKIDIQSMHTLHMCYVVCMDKLDIYRNLYKIVYKLYELILCSRISTSFIHEK